MNNKPHFLQLKPRLSSLNHNFLHYIIISITSPTNKSDSQNQYNLNLLYILRICYTLLHRKITCNRLSNTRKLSRSVSFSDAKPINSTFFSQLRYLCNFSKNDSLTFISKTVSKRLFKYRHLLLFLNLQSRLVWLLTGVNNKVPCLLDIPRTRMNK